MDKRVPRDIDVQEHRRNFIDQPVFWAVMWFVTESAIKSIIGFIATKLFVSVIWSKVVEKWNSRKEKSIEGDSDEIDIDSITGSK